MIPAVLMLTGVVSALAVFPDPTDWSDKLIQALQNYDRRFPTEKVYLHLDKDYYAAGETIWFKGYLTLQGLPDDQATNLYVELLDKNNNIVQKKLLAVYKGQASGYFDLPDNQKAGEYQLRAYTSWMLNFDPAFTYMRTLEIFDNSKKQSSDSLVVSDFAVQFFPEGGNLIAGQPNTVAFKAIDNNGYPIAVSGTVKGKSGSANITTLHDGMGSFEITPADKEDIFQATVKTAKGQTKTVALPAPVAGASIKIFNKGSRVFYQAVVSNAEDTSLNDIAIIAQMGNQLVYKAILNIGEGRISGFIPTDMLPSGIMQVTIFNKNGVPLAERLTFVRKNDLLDMDVLDAEMHKEPRTKNAIELRLPDTIQSNISISITDADAVPVDKNASSIVSSLLLTSDIKGFVYNPAWYFRNDSASTLQALDLVMMTNGWRRFSWEKIVKNEYPELKYPFEQGMYVTGTAYLPNGRPLQNGRLDMIIKIPLDSMTSYANAPINEKGQFVIPQMIFMDTALIYYQGNEQNKKGTDISVKFDPHFFDRPTQVKIPFPLKVPPPVNNNTLKQFLTTTTDLAKLNKASKTVMLQEVNVNAKKPEESIEKRYTSGMFTGDGYSFDLTKENPTALNVFQYLQSRVAGLQITGDYNNPSLSWRGGAPTLYLNEMQSDVSMLSTLSMQDIALVKVFRPPFMGGFGGGANGAIAVYTKKGGDGVPRNDKGVVGFKLYKKGGYALTKQFYSPDYSVKKDIHSLPDKRLTLYWNPNVPVDTLTHTARVEFYNNDMTKKFRVVVEGIGENGNVGRLEREY